MATTRQIRLAIVCGLLAQAATWCSTAAAEEPSRIALATTVGAVFGRSSAEFAILEARTSVLPRLSVAAALAYLDADRSYHEWQARALATVSVTPGRWVIDDRNMIYVSSESVERYRNRLRATLPGFLGRPRLSALAYDEWHYDLDRGAVVRNNLALGLALAVGSSWRVELSHVWSDNRGVADTRFWLMLATLTPRR